jgi:hypothetical protein
MSRQYGESMPYQMELGACDAYEGQDEDVTYPGSNQSPGKPLRKISAGKTYVNYSVQISCYPTMAWTGNTYQPRTLRIPNINNRMLSLEERGSYDPSALSPPHSKQLLLNDNRSKH